MKEIPEGMRIWIDADNGRRTLMIQVTDEFRERFMSQKQWSTWSQEEFEEYVKEIAAKFLG